LELGANGGHNLGECLCGFAALAGAFTSAFTGVPTGTLIGVFARVFA